MSYDGTLKFDTKIDSSGFQSGVSKLGSLASGALNVATKVFAAATTAVTAFGASAVKAGGDFEYGMSKVEAITGSKLTTDMDTLIKDADELGLAYTEGASDAETAMSILEQRALSVASSSEFTAAEAAEAYQYMAMAGWDAASQLEALPAVMHLAEASGESLGTTSDIVTDAMTAFGLEANETGRFCDVLAAAATSSNTNVSMLGESFKYAAPVAGAMGYEIEDVAVALGLMANSGVKASQAGTSLRSLLTRMAKQPKEAAAAMDALGISLDYVAEDGSTQMYSFMEIMEQLRDGFGELNIDVEDYASQMATLDEQLANGTIKQKDYDAACEELIDRTFSASGALNAEYAAMLAGQQGMTGLLSIVSASDEEFEALCKSIEESEGVTDEMVETMHDNFPEALKMAGSALDILKVNMYQDIQEPAKDAAQALGAMVNDMTAAFQSGGWEGLATSAGNALSQIVVTVAGKLPEVITIATNLVHSFCESLVSNPEIGPAGGKLLTSIITGIMSVTGDLLSTAGTLALQLAQGLVSNLPTILSAGAQLMSGLFTGLTNALPSIAQVAIDLFKTLTESIKTNLPTLIPVAMEMILNFTSSLRENFGNIVNAGLEMIVALAGALIDALPTFIETVPQIITNICGLINDNMPKLIATGMELIVKLAVGLVKAIPTLVANIPQIIQAIIAVFTAFNWISIGKNIITAIGNGIKSLASSLPTALKSIGTNMKTTLKSIDWGNLGMAVVKAIASGLKSVGSLLWNGLKALGTTAVSTFKSINWLDLGVQIVMGIAGGISGAAQKAVDAVVNLGKNLIDGFAQKLGISSPSKVMEEQGDYMVQGIAEGMAAMPQAISDALNAANETVNTWGTNLQTALSAASQNATNPVAATFLDLSSKVVGILTEIASKVLTFYSNLYGTVANGIRTVVETVLNVLQELPGKIWTILVTIVNKFIAWGQNVLQTCSTAITNTINKIINLLNTLPGKIWTILVNIINKFVQWGQNVLQTCSTAITNTINKIINLLNTLPGKIWTILVNIVNKFIQWGQNVLNACSTAITNTINKIMSLLNTLPGKIWTVLTDIVNKVIQWGNNMVQQASTGISNMISKIMSLMNELPGKIASVFSQVIAKAQQWVSDMTSKGAAAATGLYNSVVNGLSGLPGKMAEIGGNIVTGIWNGISGGWDWLKNKVSDLAQSLLSSAKNALGIESPSTEFRDQVGKWIPLGLAEGIEDKMPDTIAQMKDMANKLVSEWESDIAFSNGALSARAEGDFGMKIAGAGTTTIYEDNSMKQENVYHVPVVTPSETAKANREAFRKMVGGVK